MTKMNITLLIGNEVSNSSSYNNFFENSIILWENNEKKFFFLRRTLILAFFMQKLSTIEIIKGFDKTIDSKNYG